MNNSTIQTFLSLVRAGLWEQDVRLSQFERVDYEEIMHLAEEQTVVGLVTAGLEHVVDVKVPQEWLLQFIGQTLQIEQQNKEMNAFVARLIDKLRKDDVYAILIKGQGIAKCYEKPLWRASGDVDLLLGKDNFENAKKVLIPLSSGNKPYRNYSKELGYLIDSWSVELHGSQRTGLSTRVDKEIDAVQRDIFYDGNVRSWKNGKTTVFLPSPDNDVFIVFTHFIKHFYKEGGVSIRQLCDWCRLMWTYKEEIDAPLLETRLKKSRLISEWKGFAAVAVDYLGMPNEAMPLYRENKKWRKKAEKILAFILKGGEWRRIHDTLLVGRIYPVNTIRFLPGILLSATCLKIKERVFGT